MIFLIIFSLPVRHHHANGIVDTDVPILPTRGAVVQHLPRSVVAVVLYAYYYYYYYYSKYNDNIVITQQRPRTPFRGGSLNKRCLRVIIILYTLL